MEVKTTVSTAELLPLISALKLEMQKKGYSPLSIRGLENVWDALLHYASTVPETAFDENFREGFLFGIHHVPCQPSTGTSEKLY